MSWFASVEAYAWFRRQWVFWSLAWVMGGMAVAVVAAVAARHRVARRTGLSVPAAIGYVAWSGVALAWTASPRSRGDHYFVFGEARHACNLRLWDSGIATLVTSPECQFNLLLFVPIGGAAALAATAPTRRCLLAGAAAVPVAVEAFQYAVPSLYRVCDTRDLFTNWAGLALGWAVGRVVATRRRRTPPTDRPDPATTADPMSRY